MILTQEGGRPVFEKKKGELDAVCTNEELEMLKEMDTKRPNEYVRIKPGKPCQEIKVSIFDALESEDTEMIRLARVLSLQKYQSEPVKPIHTAVRIIFHSSAMLGRPYDINMLASVLKITSSVVQQAMKRWYKGLISQSEMREEHFVPTYLWILGLPQKEDAYEQIIEAINKYGDVSYDGRSVFSIARDYTILYYRLALGLPFSSVYTEVNAVPKEFLSIITKFETRAKISKRKIFLKHHVDIKQLFKRNVT